MSGLAAVKNLMHPGAAQTCRYCDSANGRRRMRRTDRIISGLGSLSRLGGCPTNRGELRHLPSHLVPVPSVDDHLAAVEAGDDSRDIGTVYSLSDGGDASCPAIDDHDVAFAEGCASYSLCAHSTQYSILDTLCQVDYTSPVAGDTE